MLSKTIMKRFSQNALLGAKSTATRSMASDSVTYDFKDLIVDPDQKGDPIYHKYRLDDHDLPTTATTNKAELL